MRAFTLALGWLCVALVSIGGALTGAAGIDRRGAPGAARFLSTLTLAASLLALALASWLPPEHPWTHDRLLRYGAIFLGAFFGALSVAFYRAESGQT